MSKSSKYAHFRRERASELENFAQVIHGYLNDFNSGPIYQAANQIRNKNSDDTWGYEIEGLTILLEQGKNTKPPNIRTLEMTIDVRLTAQCENWNTFDDPFSELNFRVILRGVGNKSHFFGFRVERHKDSDPAIEPHPLYHLQFNVNPLDKGDFDYGSVMSIAAPRVTHYPMDIILGISFALSNFSPEVYKKLCTDGKFLNLMKGYQEALWKPYLHTFASHWKPIDETSVKLPPNTICPYLV